MTRLAINFLLHARVAHQGNFVWVAQLGGELIDPVRKVKIWRIEDHPYPSNPIPVRLVYVYRNKDQTLSISPNSSVFWTSMTGPQEGAGPWFADMPQQPEMILPEPEFDLEEIELARKLIEDDADAENHR